VERSTEPRLAWTAAARRDPAALVLAILDVRDARAWALYVVDAARGRAILRRLPGGMEANAAALEEVSAILTSAVAAVREGLEVASKPLETVVAEQPDEGPSPERVALTPSPTPSPRPLEPPPSSERAGAQAPTSTRPFGAVLARGATLTGEVVPGVAAELGLRLGTGLGLLVHGALDRRARISTALGTFELGRSLAALEVSHALPLGPVSLEPRLGSGVEVIRRSGTAPAPGVGGAPGRTHPRFVAVAGVRARYLVAGPLAVELGADATYSPQRLRFSSGETRLASAPPFSVGALAGVGCVTSKSRKSE
jgi:hypothetical protein